MSLIDILSSINPKKSGEQLRGRCPFRENHKDGSGNFSFFVSPNINGYHCFSCKEKGRLTSLLSTRFGVPLYEAYDYVDIDGMIGSKIEGVAKEKLVEKEMYKLRPPKMYLDRGIKEKILLDKFVGENDNFYILPWIEYGRIIGHLKRNKKRLHDYRLDLKRGNHLYNLEEGIKSTILVEGFADSWRLEQWGLYAVALGGTEFGEGVIEKLRGLDEIYLAMDNDISGIKAADKIYHELRYHVDVYFIQYEGEDPDKSNKKSFFKGYSSPKDYYDFKEAFSSILQED